MMPVNIIGAGLGGMSAAITLAKKGYNSNLISKQPSERAQSVLAEGGVNAAIDTMGEDDRVEYHYRDTMAGGVYLADPNAVYNLTERAPEIMKWLIGLGVPFYMEDDKMILRNFGGQKKKRTAYAKSSTGKIIVNALIDETRKYEDAGLIKRYSNHELADLMIDKEKSICTGVVVRNVYNGEYTAMPGTVILALGGLSGFFPGMTTGTTANSGDGAAIAYSKGVAFSNLEMIQYHPTTIDIPGKKCLISEAARGEGGRLFVIKDGKPWYFMEDKYPELGNLMPRDVVSREMHFISLRDDCEDQIYLDMRGLPEKTWEKKLSDMREEIEHYLDIDPAKEPVPVTPGIHYFMGGIDTDEHHRTNTAGLYAVGECCSQYHGANRLGGNSMLGAMLGGRIAAEDIMRNIPAVSGFSEQPSKLCLGGLSGEGAAEKEAEDAKGNTTENTAEKASPAFNEELGNILISCMTIVRNEEELLKGRDRAEALSCGCAMEEKRKQLAIAMIDSALIRKESRGAHYREDHPETLEKYRKKTLSVFRDNKTETVLREIPVKRAAAGSADVSGKEGR